MNCLNLKKPSNYILIHSLYEQLYFVRNFAANLLDSRKSEETLCDSWVLSTSVCGTGVFSAHTATYSTSESGARGSGNL